MSDPHIEGRLERSLRHQVQAPRLTKRFDAAVWARIDAETAKPPARVPAASRWMFFINCIGTGAALVMMLVYGGRMLMGVEADFALPELAVSPGTVEVLSKVMIQAITFVPLALGIMLTPLGRRVRVALREMF